jgi:capsular exopolysaccharide synthesis family protein
MSPTPRAQAGSGGDSPSGSADLFGAPQRDTRPLLDWRNAVRIVRRRAWPAATVAVVVFVGAVVHAFTQVPVYEAKARILIEADRGNPAGLKDPLEESRSSVTDYQTQLMILQSRSLARTTMQSLGVWNRPVATAAPVKPRIEPGSFRAFVEAAKDAARGITSWLWEPSARVASVAPPSQPGETATSTDENRDETNRINGFLSGVRVAPVSDTRLVDVYYTSTDAPTAALYVNGVVTTFIRQNAEARMTASTDVIDWLNERLVEQRKALEASEAALTEYRQSHNIVSIGEQASLSVQKLTELTAAVTKAKTDRIEKEAMVKQLESVKGDPAALEAFPAVLANPVVQQMRSQLIALQQQEAQTAEKLGDRNQKLINIREDVKTADARLRAEIAKVLSSVRRDFAAARATETSLDQTLEAQKRETLSRNGNDVEFVLLQRDAESNRQIWQSLQQRINEFAVTRERRTSNVRIVDAAEVPQTALGENVRKDLRYGALGAFFLGLCVAFCLEYFDSRVKTPDQIKVELGLPFLGLVPLTSPAATKGKAPRGTPSPPLIMTGTAADGRLPPGFGEAFRKLRTNVRLSIPEEGMHTLLITSAGMGEGKTVIASNLATTLALANHRVLLIDADLRRPRLHKVFGVKQDPGLSNLIVGQAPAKDVVRKTTVPNLHVLTSGTLPPNPSELLESKRFKDFVGQLDQYFDWVLIDSPPLLPVTDAMILSQLVTGVIMVLSADSTPLQAARSAIDQLDTSRARILGAVLNRVDLERRAYYYADHYREEDEQYYTRSARA